MICFTSWRERWIPNTGEYLLLNDVRYSIVNKAGAVLPLDGEAVQDCELFISGAKDRGFGGPGGGNISNNTGGNFEVALVNKVANSIVKLGVLEKNTNGTYTMKYCASSLYTDGGNNQKKTVTDFVNNRLWVDSKGMICGKTGGINDYILAIRPENSKEAKPGDDLLLQIGMRKMGAVTDPVATVATMKEADYIALYDKKMLWRANLYIEQNEPELGNLDWNNAHPWNAPPDGVMTATTPKWWSVDYGNNEWNRSYDGSQNKNKLADLSPGNGGQVVQLPEFTPLRKLTGTNTLNNTVAYSFPDHPKELPTKSKGDAGSMDSPFDFVWKMMQQKAELGYWKNANGDAKNPAGVPVVGDNSWNLTTSPSKKWNNYARGHENGNQTDTQMFIPSLGLYYKFHWVKKENAPDVENGNDEQGLLQKNDDANWKWDYTFEAGTDCVGFAQRAASYAGRTYKWYQLPDGIMDQGTINYNTVLDGYGVNDKVRNYPSNSEEAAAGGWKHFADDVIAKEIEEVTPSTSAHLAALRKVVPGDIWVKDSTTDGTDNNKRNHIAIVAYVPPNAEELSVTDLMNQIILIEGEFTNKIQSVIKKLSVGMYNANEISVGINFYNNFTVTDQSNDIGDQGINLNCQSWAIRRLK